LTGAHSGSSFEEEVNIASPNRIRIARTIAIAADFLQIVIFPIFSFVLPVEEILDVFVCASLTWLVGWHFAFLPSFLVKAVPVVDMIPSWTVAVLIATRHAPIPVATEVRVEPPPIDVSAEK
jgi:hypothetical protein